MDSRQHNEPVVLTKLHRPPVTADLVCRKRLHEQLDRSLEVPLTLVSAPAGYGKSMLVSHWLETSAQSSGWISLDESDDSALSFLGYLVAAVRTTHPDACRGIDALFEAVETPSSAVLARTLVNDLDAIDQRFVLVLDDFHRITGHEIHELLAGLLEHPPKSVHLVIITRKDPPLKLAKFRGLGQIVDVRMRDLRFTPAESKTFLQSNMEGQPTDSELNSLHIAVEGWAAGLRLGALALRYQADPEALVSKLQTGITSIREYLFLEVLDGQPAVLRSCLLQAAVLDRFCADLFDTVCESPGLEGRRFIEDTVQNGLFAIELDAEGTWYRFHHLFQDLLRRELRLHMNDQEIAALHLRASSWFEHAGLIDEAISHALQAGNPAEAARIVKVNSRELLLNEQTARLESLLNRLPTEVVDKDAFLIILVAYIHYQRLRLPEWATSLERAQTILEETSLSAEEEKGLQAGIDALRSAHCYWMSDLEEAERLARRAVRDLPENSLRLRMYATIAFAATLQATGRHHEAVSTLDAALGDGAFHDPRCQALLNAGKCLICWVEGALPEMRRSADQIGMYSREEPASMHRALAAIYAAIPRYFQNDHNEIEGLLRQTVDHPYSIASVLYIDVGAILVFTLCSQDRFPEAREIAERVNRYGVEIGNPILVTNGLALKAEIALRRGQLPEAKRWARNFFEQPLQAKYNAYLPELTLAWALLQVDTASSRARMSSLLDRLEEYARKVYYRPVLIQTLALRALLLDRQGDRPTALKILSESVAEAKNGSGVRIFLDFGPQMADLLADLHGQDDDTDFVEEILEEFANQRSEAAPFNAKVRSPADLPNPDELTNRELDVLELLTRRLQNKEIAAQLGISTHTVGTHLKVIYQKLDVHGRREAVGRAIERGIVTKR